MSPIEITYNSRNFYIEREPYKFSIRRGILKPFNYTQRFVYTPYILKKSNIRNFYVETSLKLSERKFLVSDSILKTSSVRLAYTEKALPPKGERKFHLVINNQVLTYSFPTYLLFRYENERKGYIEISDRNSQRKFCLVYTNSDWRNFLVQRENKKYLYSVNTILQLTNISERKCYIETNNTYSQRKFKLNVLSYDWRNFLVQTINSIPIYTFEAQISLNFNSERKGYLKVAGRKSERKFILETKTKISERKFNISLTSHSSRNFIVLSRNNKLLYEFETLFGILKISERKFTTSGFLYYTERKGYLYSTDYGKYYRKQKILSKSVNTKGSIILKKGSSYFTTPNDVYIHTNIDQNNETSQINQISIIKQNKNISISNIDVIVGVNNNIYNKPVIKGKSTLVDVSRNVAYTQQKEKIERRVWRAKFMVRYGLEKTTERKGFLEVSEENNSSSSENTN